jgi:hypothetical protein
MKEGSCTVICATCGRHTLMERSLRLFLNQNYNNEHTLLIYNNSNLPQVVIAGLPEEVNPIKKVVLINQWINSETDKPYENLGQIYNDALKHVDPETEIISHWDDDDIFLTNHIEEGVRGYNRAKKQGKLAYKPKKSYYRHAKGIELIENTLEPSIFVSFEHLKQYGYSQETTAQHLQWVNPLVYGNKILVDESKDAVSTLVYNWGDTIPTFKTSGNPIDPMNFNNYRRISQDHGDGIITPWRQEHVKQYYSI